MNQLKGEDDLKEKGFISHSIEVRLSKIVAGIGFEKYAKELSNKTFQVTPVKLTTIDLWESYVQNELGRVPNGNCMKVSWFFLENYMYRKCLEELGYFSQTSPNFNKDPFLPSKLESLNAALPSFQKLCNEVSEPTFSHLLLCCLWGNRSDLSLSSGIVDNPTPGEGILLVNDLEKCEKHVILNEKGSVIIILDNCGAELLADLRLALNLSKNQRKVILHAKSHPVFVSDATRKDIHVHIDRLCTEDIKLGHELKEKVENGQIEIYEDLFYTSPLEFAQVDVHLKNLYSEACLVIVKGDANYRRILGDRHLPCSTPFSHLVSAFTLTKVLAIRTCKSPVIIGISSDVFEKMSKQDTAWCVNGTVGLIQFS